MPVLYKRVKTPNGEFITRTKCRYYNPPCVGVRKRRGIRSTVTPEGKKELNKRQAKLKRKYEILNNFSVGDWWVTLTHGEEKAPDIAHKEMTKVIAKLQRWCKKKNIVLMYYAKTESSDRVRPHHHLIIKNSDSAVIGKLMEYWQEYGNIKETKKIYGLSDGKLTEYFLNGGNHKELTYEKYTHSRNLLQPEIERRVYPYDSFRQNPRPPKCKDEGYRYEIRNLYNGYPDIDGFTYQEYTLVKVKEEQKE